MAFKSVYSYIGSVDTACWSNLNFLLKPKFPYFWINRAKFCSHSDENNSSSSSRESEIKSLLNASSPLRLSAEFDLENDMWATSPYPEGTVFRGEEPNQTNEDQDNNSSSIILFPGQGNQFVGMAKNLLKYPVALDMFDSASNILKYDLKKICLQGPENLLNNTKYCQPATFVCSLALLEKLKDERPWALSNCTATCGYSLGEITALVFAGCMNFETGLKVVKMRAELMAKSCEKISGGMLTIITGPHTTLGDALTYAIEHCKAMGIENPVCATASYLYPNCKVIAGNTEALDFLINNAKNYGIRRHSKLPVSGAFHTTLMKDAGDAFREYLKDIQLQKPVIKVYSNVTGKLYANEYQIKKILPRQIYCPIKWEQTLQIILHPRVGVPLPFIYECGPGRSLAATVHKVNYQAVPTCFSVKL